MFANSWASMCKTLFKATWTECWIFHRNDRQAEEFTTLLKEKDDQIAQLLEEGNDWYWNSYIIKTANNAFLPLSNNRIKLVLQIYFSNLQLVQLKDTLQFQNFSLFQLKIKH